MLRAERVTLNVYKCSLYRACECLQGGVLERSDLLDTYEGSHSSHKRTENISFRLNKDIIDELRRDAEQKQINLNTLANQVFDYYVKFANSAKLR